jgi:hypothetical protein
MKSPTETPNGTTMAKEFGLVQGTYLCREMQQPLSPAIYVNNRQRDLHNT